MSNKPVSIEQANASSDETKPKIKLVAKHFGFDVDEKGKP